MSEIGKRYGRWTVLSEVESNHRWHPKFICRCECGTERVVFRISLRQGRSKSCGCLHREVAGKHGKTHGLAGTPIYFTFKDMHRRCYDPKHKSFARYGGRGITVCERWHDLESFVSDLGERPHGKTLDRIDNDKEYSPENCQWADVKQQQRNKHTVRWIEVNGERMILADVARRFGKNPQTVACRLKRGWSVDDAVRIPTEGFQKKNPGL